MLSINLHLCSFHPMLMGPILILYVIELKGIVSKGLKVHKTLCIKIVNLFCFGNLNVFPLIIKQRQPATSKNESFVIAVDGDPKARSLLGNNATTWTKLVMEMYPPRSSMR